MKGLTRYPLLKSQLPVFEECMLYPECHQYNLPIIIPRGRNADIERMIATYHVIFRARKEWRIRFGIDEQGQPYQWVDESKVLYIQHRKLSQEEYEDYEYNHFCRPFDIFGVEPLVRVEFIDTPIQTYLLMDVHHLIMDGVSYFMNFSNKDFNEAYLTGKLTGKEYSMLDAALEERDSYNKEEYAKARAYYLDKFRDVEFATIGKSTDNPIGNFIRCHAFIDSNTVDAWCEKNNIALNLLFQAAFTRVVASMIGKERFAYTIYSHGRLKKRWRDTYGMYSLEMPIVCEVTENQSLTDLIHSIRTELFSAIRYSAYPITDLCRETNKSTGICFNFQAIEGMEEILRVGDTTYEFIEIERGDDGHDMVVFIFPMDGEYDIRIESSDAINNKETIQTVANKIKETVQVICLQSI